jgi:polygalacturonase
MSFRSEARNLLFACTAHKLRTSKLPLYCLLMSANNPRRTFLKTATAGVGALIALPETAVGQTQAAAAKTSYEVTAFGAKGDGHTLDSPAINRAIEAAASAGGGTVSFPAGTYLCYSIHLKSNVALHLSPGATILAADPPTDLSSDLASPAASPANDPAESNAPWESYQDFGHNHWHNSLLWGEGLENVSITGPGLIWGKGLSRGWGAGPIAEHPGVGNKAIALKNCRNVLLRDFSILHGGHFGILATGVDNLTIDNLKIDTNRDGMDIDCCRNVRVTNCSVNSPWDDAICLKSSFALGYARATEMVTISDCVVSGSFEEGTLLDATYKRFAPDAKVNRTGRIKFGTESNGGFKNITITNCVFDGCWGFALETVDGGLLEDVTITNITMRDLAGAPIFLRLGARMRGPAGVPVGALRRVLISNIVCSNAGSPVSSIISGIPGHEIEDVKLSNILIQHQGGQPDTPLQLAEKEKDYPEPSMFGTTPAHGFFIRHAKGIEINDVEIQCAKEDARPAFVLDDVTRADFFRVTAPRVQGKPVIVLNNVRDFSVNRSKSVPDSEIESTERKEL